MSACGNSLYRPPGINLFLPLVHPPEGRGHPLYLPVVLFLLFLAWAPWSRAAGVVRGGMKEGYFGAGMNLLGPALNYGSVFLLYGVNGTLQAETGAGATAIYGGLTLFPLRQRSRGEVRPYMGLLVGYSNPPERRYKKGVYAYMPVGIRYRAGERWVASAEIAATTILHPQWGAVYGGIKLGYLFPAR